MRTRVKLCGMTGWNDVELAIGARADYFGMIFAPSPRRIEWNAFEQIAVELADQIQPVAVFVDPSADDVARVLDVMPNALVQFSGSESPSFVRPYGDRAIKAIHVADEDNAEQLAGRCEAYAASALLFDTARGGLAGGTGETFAWTRIEPIVLSRRAWIAGGLTPENVGACVRALRPFGVDVRSGVETTGRKDTAKMRAFVAAVRECDET